MLDVEALLDLFSPLGHAGGGSGLGQGSGLKQQQHGSQRLAAGHGAFVNRNLRHKNYLVKPLFISPIRQQVH